MNAAARLVHQQILTRRLLLTHYFSKQQVFIPVLCLLVLFSAMSLVYVTHLTRLAHASHRHAVVEHDRLQIERGQLLLERATLMMQARTQQLAENDLEMVIPNQRAVVVIRE